MKIRVLKRPTVRLKERRNRQRNRRRGVEAYQVRRNLKMILDYQVDAESLATRWGFGHYGFLVTELAMRRLVLD